MKKRRRAGITLTEVLVLTILISIFLLAVFQTFNVIQTTMQTNRLLVDRLYLEANIENFFTILHDELRWGGSMTDYLKFLGDPYLKGISLHVVENERIETHYAGVEKVILKKLTSHTDFPSDPQEVSEELIAIFGHSNFDPDGIFFALFPTEIPTPNLNPHGSGGWWIVHTDDPANPNIVEILKSEYYIHPATITTSVGLVSGQAVEIKQTLEDYVFIIFHEGPGDPIPGSSFRGLLTNNGMYWGEQIAQSAIVWDENTKSLSLEKYIPTVSTLSTNTIDLLLLENVHAFEASTNTAFSGNRTLLQVGISCEIPNPYGKAAIEISKKRNFWFWEGQ